MNEEKGKGPEHGVMVLIIKCQILPFFSLKKKVHDFKGLHGFKSYKINNIVRFVAFINTVSIYYMILYIHKQFWIFSGEFVKTALQSVVVSSRISGLREPS